jgi:hypothetical protein
MYSSGALPGGFITAGTVPPYNLPTTFRCDLCGESNKTKMNQVVMLEQITNCLKNRHTKMSNGEEMHKRKISLLVHFHMLLGYLFCKRYNCPDFITINI